MKNLKSLTVVLSIAFVCVFSLSCSKSENVPITGHRNLYVNPVDQVVNVYPESEIKAYIDAKRAIYNKVTAEMEAVRGRCEKLTTITESPFFPEEQRRQAGVDHIQCNQEYLSASMGMQKFSLDDAPETDLSTKIDSDGKFEIKVPTSSRYALIIKPNIIIWVKIENKPKDVDIEGFDLNAAYTQ